MLSKGFLYTIHVRLAFCALFLALLTPMPGKASNSVFGVEIDSAFTVDEIVFNDSSAFKRPFGPNAPWNIPVAHLPAHPDWKPYTVRLWFDDPAHPGVFDLMFRQYTYPVYRAFDATMLAPVETEFETNLHGQMVPWNPSWIPASGTDAQVIVLDPLTGREWNFFVVSFDGQAVRAVNANLVQQTVRQGNGANPASYWTKENGYHPSRGCGIQYLAMLVRPEEIAQGEIRHALSMPVRGTDGTFFLPPATKLEHPDYPPGIPEGMRFAVRISDTRIEQWVASLPPEISPQGRQSARIIARALRDYGMFVTDTSEGPCFQFEDYLTAGQKWEALGQGQQFINGKEYPRRMLDGLITLGSLYAIVPSNEYLISSGAEAWNRYE